MAWALQFDGVNDYVSLGSDVIVGGGEFLIEIECYFSVPFSSSHLTLIGGSSQGSNELAVDYRSGNFRTFFYSGSTLTAQAEVSSPITDGEVRNVRVRYLAGRLGISIDNGAWSEDTGSLGASVSFGRFGGRQTSSTRYLKGGILTINCTRLTLDNSWDATASDHTNGGGSAPYPQPILVDTTDSNDATGVNFPTDNLDCWVNLGGGSPYPWWLFQEEQ